MRAAAGRRLGLAIGAVMLAGGTAHAAPTVGWHYIGESRELIGSTGEDEGDTDFRATCKPGATAELGIGAEENVGTGAGEAVSLTLASGARSVRLDGHSKQSPNFQMTGSVELVATVDKTHAIFQLLADPGAIKVSGKTISTTWPDRGRAAATKAFLTACFGG